MKNLESIFGLLLFPLMFLFQSVDMPFFRRREGSYRYHLPLLFLTFFMISTSLYAANECSNTVDYTFPNTQNTYTDTKTLSGWGIDYDGSYQNYYFSVPVKGTIKITLSGSSVAFRHKIDGCPDYDDGSTSDTINVNSGDDFNLRVDNFEKWVSRTYTLTVEFIPDTPAPPTISGIPDQTTIVNQSFNLDLSSYTTEPNGDTITYSVDTLPDGLSLDSSTGIISGTPTATGTYTVTATATDKDGSDSDEFTITVNELTIVENADDLCYEEPISSGLMCFDMGFCSGGIGCKNTYPLKNIGDSDLTNVTAIYDESGLGGSFGSSCGVDPSGTCGTAHDIDFGPFGFFGSATEYNLSNTIPPNDNSNSIWAKNFMGGSCFNGESLYGQYMKDGVLHRGKLKKCVAHSSGGYRPFTLRHQDIFRGKMLTIGNTVLVAPSPQSSANCNSYTNGSYISDASDTNDEYKLCAYYSDTSANFPTTSATLPISNPDDIEIAWAGLYWQALVDDNTNVENMTIQLKHNNEPYHPITYNQIDWGDGVGKSGYISYSAFADITDLFRNNGWKDGTITVGDIPVQEGEISNLGTYGAWTLVVVYKDPHEKNRIFSIYDGWQIVDDEHAAVNITTAGFLTPKQKPFESSVSVFAAEGDKHIENDYLKAKPTNSGDWTNLSHTTGQTFYSAINTNPSFTRVPDPVNNQGIDIQSFNLGDGGYDIMEPQQTSMDFKFGSDQDRYWPSMIAFSTELIAPDLCYDYAYEQNGRYFTEENDGSKDPRIKGDLFSSSPINVSIFFKNRENSDFTIEGLTMDIGPIDTTQASYINDSVKVTLPGESERHSATIGSSSPSGIDNIQIGHIGGKEYFYTYYSLSPEGSSIDMALNASVDFDSVIRTPAGTTVTLPYRDQVLNSEIPFCAEGNFSYTPIYGTFNVEQKNLGKYNIFTQVSRRVDNFEVAAYDIDNIDSRINVNTIVAVELIDAGAFHEAQTSCDEPDSVLTPRIWVTFDNNVSHTDFTKDVIDQAIAGGLVSDQIRHQSSTIDEAEDYYAVIRRNTAFRVSYIDVGNGDLLQTEPVSCSNNNGRGNNTCYNLKNFPNLVQTDLGNGVGKCATNMGNPNTIASYCGNAGQANASAITKQELSECMECIYGYGLHYICSRDNFAIRPEAFKVSLTDDNTSTFNVDFANNTDKSGTTGSPINLVAGYPYRFDINATSHTDENPVRGYVQGFNSNDPRKRAFMAWSPSSTVNCNEPDDRNMSFYLIDGTNTHPNPLNSWEDRHDTMTNVGEYTFKVIDEEWTKYDWEANLTMHHNTPHFIANSTPDCLKEDPANNSVGNLGERVGCETSSVHTGASQTYKTVYIRSYPYELNVSGLIIGARPGNDTSNNTFVYINTLDNTQNYPDGYADREDENMSYNIQGTFFAAGYDHQPLSNFVNNCYADNIDMLLNYNYYYTAPANGLHYDLIDYNSTDSSVVYRTREDNALAVDNIITQTANYFAKDMKGSLTMDLGYNYDRTFNTPLNPIYVDMKDFNISYAAQPSTLYVNGINNHKIFGDKKLDQNVTFVYGRAKPSGYFYDNITTSPVSTPVGITIYCSLGLTACQNRGLAILMNGLLSDAQSNEANWWFAQVHNVTQDGKITLTSTNGTVSPVDPTSISLTNGIDSSVTVTNSGGTTPYTVNIDLGNTTDRWLIYNKDSNIVPSPFYKVRFIGPSGSGWTGEGKTGHVVGDDINKKKTRRLDW